jgi:2-oxoglutarate dehydrogenase E2 component (dihydrolipoamide succinyltransferase)
MATEVIMPQMGESIAEGTVTKWLKQVGERVERDEPLLEISTDKVDTVIPSPAAGTVTELRVKEGDTVPINTVIAVLDGAQGKAAEAAPTPADKAPEWPAPALPPAAAPPPAPPAPTAPPPPPPARAEVPPVPRAEARPAPARPAPSPASSGGNGAALSPVHPVTGRVLTSPLVKRIAREEKVDLRQVRGTGMGGRVTRGDILAFLETRGRGAPAPGLPAAAAPAPAPAASPAWLAQVHEGDRVEKMPQMRRLIAEHMSYSKRVSPHVYTMFEFDMTNIVEIRAREKAAFEKTAGVKLTYLPFVARAVCHALQTNPAVNASVRGDDVIYHRSVNLGIAVALENGLIVPVVKRAEEKSFLGLARSIADLAERARNKRLTADDVTEGTFTITNPGVFGSLIGFAVINQPQVGILDMGAIVKRPVVIETESGDTIGIRSLQLMSISYDHRIVDGATADHFMNAVRDYLKAWSEPLL